MAKRDDRRGLRLLPLLVLMLVVGVGLCALGIFGYIRANVADRTGTSVRDSSQDQTASEAGAGVLAGGDTGSYSETSQESERNAYYDAGSLPASITSLEQAQSALDVIDSALGEDVQFDSGSIQTSEGMRFYRFQQEYEGIPVAGRNATVIVSASGEPIGISTNAIAVGGLATTAAVGRSDAEAAAEGRVAQDCSVPVADVRASGTELVIYSIEQDPVLAYVTYTSSTVADASREVVVDAQSGQIITTASTDVNATVTATGQAGSTYTNFSIDTHDGQQLLHDSDHNIYVYGLGYNKGSKDIGSSPASDDKLASTSNASGVDALGNLVSTSDFYKRYVGWEGFNGQGFSQARLNVYVEVSGAYNGTWRGSLLCITFTGKDSAGNQASQYLDFVAHEYSHAVTQYTAGLVGSSGQNHSYDAINEALSDIFGEAVEREARGECDWRFGPSSASWSRDFSAASDLRDGAECHESCMAIDHIAYLMAEGQDVGRYTREQTRFFQGTKGGSTKSFDEYVTFWQRVRLGLPSTCSYTQLARVGCGVADGMYRAGEITKAQWEGILNALSYKGLLPSELAASERAANLRPETTRSTSSQGDLSATVLVIDTSGSMRSSAGTDSDSSKMDVAKDACTTLMNQLAGMNSIAQGQDPYAMGIVSFDEGANIVYYPTTDSTGKTSAVEGMSASGGTNVLDGLQKGVDSLASFTGTRTMILLSDGEDTEGNSDETILAKAREASGEGIRIFTVGFGRQGDLDEDLLRSIASVGGGTYQYADPTSSMSLIGSFLGDQARSTGEVLSEDEGTLNQGETSEARSFDVGEEMGDLSAVLAWPGSKMESVLTDPLGRVVDQGYSGLTVDDSQIPSIVVIENPLPGAWSVSVHATETSQTDEPYYSLVSFRQTGPLRNEELEPWQVVSAVALPLGALLVVGSAVLLRGMGRKAA